MVNAAQHRPHIYKPMIYLLSPPIDQGDGVDSYGGLREYFMPRFEYKCAQGHTTMIKHNVSKDGAPPGILELCNEIIGDTEYQKTGASSCPGIPIRQYSTFTFTI